RAELSGLAERAGLVEIGENAYYWVAPLTHSVPYVTESTAALLDSIGVRFQERLAEEGLPPYKYHISSALRTQEDQAALRRVNVNAAVGTSSHEFGTTFDIHFKKYRYGGDARAEVRAAFPDLPYDYLYDEFSDDLAAFYERMTDAYVSRLKALLGETLIELEDEGYLVTVMERRQPVFHTTLAQRLVSNAEA
ncbi:MAG: DUF5715 family protein, partial [Rhodothermales bacterium]|nr:DUF5715 family protein [Rhodothermales bacterium]